MAGFEALSDSDVDKLIRDMNDDIAIETKPVFLELLHGRSYFVKNFIINNVLSNDEDRAIRTAYYQLQDVLRNEVKESKFNGGKSHVFESLQKIESEELSFPFGSLQKCLMRLVARQEPHGGWPSPISSPVLRLGKIPDNDISQEKDKRLTIVDRKEVESIRAVKRMIEQFLHESKPERPLSIAVFGPPGAGKSVAVKKIIESVDHEDKKTIQRTINLSQLTGVEGFSVKVREAIDARDEKTLIIFFDEFDSTLNEIKHGWLKYFLAMMEDGEFNNVPIKKAIFVFAGGTCDTFEEFSLADRSRSDPQWVDFSEAKGPDFVSRLRGHINVVGINPSSPDDELFLIRRALALRFLLSQAQGLSDSQEAKIDPNLLNAFLHVPFYIHGARSMRMLVDLCENKDKRTLSMSAVPPIHQLNMQVDGKAFAALASGQTEPVTGDYELELSDRLRI